MGLNRTISRALEIDALLARDTGAQFSELPALAKATGAGSFLHECPLLLLEL